jgi:hypothetical protein
MILERSESAQSCDRCMVIREAASRSDQPRIRRSTTWSQLSTFQFPVSSESQLRPHNLHMYHWIGARNESGLSREEEEEPLSDIE